MIIGNIYDTKAIELIHPYLETAFKWIRENYLTIHQQDAKQIVLIPNELYVNIDEPTMKERTEQLIEVHKKYIDIHVPINKTETIGWEHISKLRSPIAEYDEDLDRALYCSIPSCFIPITPGNFCIMTPSDGHAPIIGQGQIKKLCVKIRVIE